MTEANGVRAVGATLTAGLAAVWASAVEILPTIAAFGAMGTAYVASGIAWAFFALGAFLTDASEDEDYRAVFAILTIIGLIAGVTVLWVSWANLSTFAKFVLVAIPVAAVVLLLVKRRLDA